MLCVNTTSVRGYKEIRLNDNLVASRMYIADTDITSFPNRLVFSVQEEAQAALHAELSSLAVEWVIEEFNRIGRGPMYIVVPFALRVQDETYTNFRERTTSSADSEVNLNLGEPKVFFKGMEIPTLCVACTKQEVLKGAPCPDYVPGNLSCVKTSRFALQAMDTFYLNNKGELVYNAASIRTTPTEQVESDSGTSS